MQKIRGILARRKKERRGSYGFGLAEKRGKRRRSLGKDGGGVNAVEVDIGGKIQARHLSQLNSVFTQLVPGPMILNKGMSLEHSLCHPLGFYFMSPTSAHL